METLLTSDPPLVKEAWRWMQGWYKTAYNLPPPPVCISLAHITAEQVEVYRKVPPPGDNMTIETSPFSIDDYIPLMDKIEWSVYRLWRHLSGRASSMQAEHLQYWLTATTHKEQPDTANWERVVEILQTAFRDDRISTECTWQMVVLVPKGDGEFRGIGIVGVLWKALSGVINRRIRAAVKLNNFIHGLLGGWGTWTAYLKSKFPQQMMELLEVLYKFFLDIRKP